MIPDGVDTAPIIRRFWCKVKKGGAEDCWIWIGGRDYYGYGHFVPQRGIRTMAHRFSYWLHTGNMPDHIVMHTCDNPPCVNPRHLRSATQSDNIADSWRKGRQVGRTKLTRDQIEFVLRSKLPSVVLAEQLNVTAANIRMLRRGIIWKEIYEEIVGAKEASRSLASPA